MRVLWYLSGAPVFMPVCEFQYTVWQSRTIITALNSWLLFEFIAESVVCYIVWCCIVYVAHHLYIYIALFTSDVYVEIFEVQCSQSVFILQYKHNNSVSSYFLSSLYLFIINSLIKFLVQLLTIVNTKLDIFLANFNTV